MLAAHKDKYTFLVPARVLYRVLVHKPLFLGLGIHNENHSLKNEKTNQFKCYTEIPREHMR